LWEDLLGALEVSVIDDQDKTVVIGTPQPGTLELWKEMSKKIWDFPIPLFLRRCDMRKMMPILIVLMLACPAWSKTLWVYTRSDGVEVTTDHLSNIPPEYRDKAKSINVPDQGKAERERRRAVAKKFQEMFLDEGLNFYVSLSGPDDTILMLKWVLIGRPFVHKFMKSDVVNTLRECGFKQVVFYNDLDWDSGLHFRMTYDLN